MTDTAPDRPAPDRRRPVPLDGRAARVAVVQLFAFNGLVMGAYAGGLATFKDQLRLSSWQMSVLFVFIGAAAIAAMQVGGRLSDRLGARRVALAAVVPEVVAAGGLALVAAHGSYGWLLAAGVALGLGNGGLDVSMNALGVQIERARGKPVMSSFHGAWSLGNLAGAAAIAAVARATGWSGGRTITAVCLGCAVVGLGLWLSARRITPETAVVAQRTASGQKVKLPAVAYVFGLMAIGFGVGEGTGMDWSAIQVAAVADVAPAIASLGVVALTAAMVLIRLTGDRIVARLGRRTVVRLGSATALAGYLVAALSQPLPLLLLGWGLVGLGIGVIAPQVYSAAGHAAGGRGLAVVVTFGYATFLIAPAAMGVLVTAWGVQRAMFVPALLLAGLVLAAGLLPRRDAGAP
ncbi:MAG: MFS transporter [Propionibacteriaceae bacterium]|jgi:MFS family permease|nr:MFS transporter [Propionibacteriaceae bacterium]